MSYTPREEGDEVDPFDDGGWTGDVEAKVKQDLDALITSHPMGEGLSAMAVHLAHTLDHAEPMFRAALSRELRGVLGDLAGMSATHDDEDLERDLSTPTKPEGTDGDPD